jgi:hypothetical protein
LLARRRHRLWVPEGLEDRVLLAGSPTYYTVNLTSDTGASSGTDPKTNDPSGDLLWAITQANANTNPAGTVINFDQTVFSTQQTITLTSTLTLSETAGPEVIDGPGASLATISGNNAVRVFSVDSGVTATLTGLTISGGVVSNTTDGVYVAPSATAAITGNSISNNGVGIEVAGSATIGASTGAGNTISGNTSYGIWVDRSGTATIGGTSTGAGNIVSGNGGPDIRVESGTAAITGNSIFGNSGYGILLNSGGTATITSNSITDQHYGIDVYGAATIGGTSAGAGNSVSGNTNDGIRVESGATAAILGNSITNNYNGIEIDSSIPMATIGGTSAGAGNSISGNTNDGILVDSGGTATIIGNSISDQHYGIDIDGAATIGGTSAGASNTISGNTYEGIVVDAGTAAITGNSISNNSVGIDVPGSSIATIGGTSAGAGNSISGNREGIEAGSGDTITGNPIIGNSITNNTNGIDVYGAATIGGTSAGAGNSISGNTNDGIRVNKGNTAAILGNSITNNYNGIEVDGGPGTIATIGGTSAGAGNSISGNANDGILVYLGVTATIAGNSITNNYNGILVESSSTTIGGIATGAGNIISGNANDGILVQYQGADTITGDSITGNPTGILVGYDASSTCIVTARYNDLSGNSLAGVTSIQTNPSYAVTATYDWWGSATGPHDPANNPGGTGSAVSANVIYNPWLPSIAPPVFSALAGPTITYGTPSVTLSGTILAGSIAPPSNVSITMGGATQSAAIQADGSFSSVFNTASFGVAGSPYTITYAYAATVVFLAATDTSQVLTVTPGTPVITWHNPAGIVYGTPLSNTQLDATASVPGTFTYTPPAGTVLGADTNQVLGVSFTPTDTTDYTTASAIAHINVLMAQPSFSRLTPSQSITYGQSTIDLSGQITAPTAIPTGQHVSIVIGSVSGQGTVRSDGSFSATINTNSLSASSTPYTIDYSYAGGVNFESASDGSTTLTINQATPLLTWSNPASIVYGTALSITQLDATASVPGSFTYTPAAGTILGAGSNQLLSVSFTPADSTDYTTASAIAHINVLIAQPSFSQLTPSQSITFGQSTNVSGRLSAISAIPTGEQVSIAIGSTSVTATISPGGSFSATINTSGLGALSTPYPITYSYAGDASFPSTSDASTTLTVYRATPTLNWPNPTDIAYGTPLSSTQLDAAASVAGSFAYTPAAGSVLKAGAGQTLSVRFTPTDTTDYTTATATVSINVLQATPTITWSSPADITHGTALDAAQLDASANVPGTFTYTPAAGTVLAAGSGQVLSVHFTPTDTVDYTTTTTAVTINVLKATPVLTWADPASIVYGTVLGSAQLDATASVPGTFTYAPSAGTILKAGDGQTLSVRFTPTDGTDYTTDTATATIGVTRATPVLTVSAPGGTYDGTPFPATVAIASGIPGLNNTPAASLEDATPILTYYERAGTSGTSLGSSPPTAAGTYTVLAGFPGSTDYAPTQSTPVVFTIDRGAAAIAVVVSTSSAVYGQSLTFVATVAGASMPSRTVTFFDGATSLATIPLDGSGRVTLTTTGLAIGSHAITATYSGDANIFGSQSGSTTELVSQAATEIILVPHPVFRKKKVVSLGLTAEIEPVAPGGGVPTGLVTFEFIQKHRKKIKIKTLGTATVNAGAATLTLKPKQVLNKPITIIYSGDPDYRASTLTPPKLTQKALKSWARPTAAGQ